MFGPYTVGHVKNDRIWLRPFLPITKDVTYAFTVQLQRHQFTKKKHHNRNLRPNFYYKHFSSVTVYCTVRYLEPFKAYWLRDAPPV
jgi:hypothetical protein